MWSWSTVPSKCRRPRKTPIDGERLARIRSEAGLMPGLCISGAACPSLIRPFAGADWDGARIARVVGLWVSDADGPSATLGMCSGRPVLAMESCTGKRPYLKMLGNRRSFAS